MKLRDVYHQKQSLSWSNAILEFFFSAVVFCCAISCSSAQRNVASSQGQTDLRHQYETLSTKATRDPSTGAVTVDLNSLRSGLIPYLRDLKLNPSSFRIFLNGQPVRQESVAGGPATVVLQSLPINDQRYIDVEILDPLGNVIHITDPTLFENLNPTLFKDTAPVDVRASGPGIDSSLISTSAFIQQQKGSWYFRPGVEQRNPALFKAFLAHGSDLDVDVTPTDKVHVRVSYLDPKTGTRTYVPASSDDFFFSSNADFSWHLFDWDRWISGRFLRFYRPRLSQDTIDLALATQQKNGAFWRELTFYLTSYQRPYTYKFGKRKMNGEAFNPPLIGWAALEMCAWNPSLAKKIVPKLTEAIRQKREWLETEPEVVVKSPQGKIIGFHWTSLGSGRDNAFRGDLFVDLMTYYKMLLDEERAFRIMQGQSAIARELKIKSQSVAETLNTLYWDEAQGMYVDLVKSSDGTTFTRDTTLNAVGFWPMMANVPSPHQLQRLLANLQDPTRFGGPFLPSLSRNDPRMHEIGNYWRGGGWGPDFDFLFDGLLRNDLRAEARSETLRMLSALTEASNAYKLGHTPYLLIHQELQPHAKQTLEDPAVRAALERYPGAETSLRKGQIPEAMGSILHDPQIAQALTRHPGTIWETIGLWTDAHGEKYVSWGKEIRSDGSLHETRGGGEPGTRQYGFAGWGAVPLEAIRSGLGVDAVPALVATPTKQNVALWFHYLAQDPMMRYHHVEFAKTNPMKRMKVAQGYLAVSPAYDPQSGVTEFDGLSYNGNRFSMKIDREKLNRIRLTVNSARPFNLQFNRHWTNRDTPCDAPLAESDVTEVGGSRKVVVLTLHPTYPTDRRSVAAREGECALALEAMR